ncbi:MAG: hypothetical protein U0Q12_21545 [Vicinamibacterales bacterium]
MSSFIERTGRTLERPLCLQSRMLLVAATLLLALVYLYPLWNLTFFAPQYQDGLRLDIYSYTLVGGHGGQDVKEVNLLNHYIGMRPLENDSFAEFKWIPFVVGALGLMFLRAAVLGTVAQLLDVVVLFLYFSAFALWSFAYKMYAYGHELAPTAAVKVAPFTPPILGYKQIANFEVYSYPKVGSYALGLVGVLLVVALVTAWRAASRASQTAS